MDVLITDVTEMGGGNYCVAGWDIDAKRMIRPLPGGSNWPAALLSRYGIAPGTVIRVNPHGTSNGAFPHRTEDMPINVNSIAVLDRSFSEWIGPAAPAFSADMASGFSGNLQWKSVWEGIRQSVYVLPGTQSNSLIAIRVPRSSLTFSEAFEKLKATLNDGSAKYQLTVSSKALKEAWRHGGLQGVGNALPARGVFHIRVGLARAFQNPPKCFAMLNGVL